MYVYLYFLVQLSIQFKIKIKTFKKHKLYCNNIYFDSLVWFYL